VISTVPINASIGVNINSNITANFSEAMALLTINTSTFTLKQGATTILGGVNYSVFTATFNPNLALAPGTVYNATITKGVTDTAGNPMAANYSWSFTTAGATPTPTPAPSAGAVPLGLAATYGLAAYSAITNVPTSHSIIDGDAAIKINGLTSMTGFTISDPIGAGEVTGSVHAADAEADAVYTALHDAYLFAKGMTPDTGFYVVGTTDLGTLDAGTGLGLGHLPPGVYSSGSSMMVGVTHNIVLDGGPAADPDAIWIFNVGSDLTVLANVTLLNGAQIKNVYWAVTGSASIGTDVTFYGNILAGASITCAGNDVINGRLLGGAEGAGEINLNGLANTVTVP
jgi:hypothetical protein